MTPEGTTVLGRGRFKNLWYRIGHGPMGWTIGLLHGAALHRPGPAARPNLPLDGLTLR
jgi:hypothetical protein